jgi:hypothetical protein
MKTKLNRPVELQLIDFRIQGCKLDQNSSSRRRDDIQIERSGGEDVPQIDDFLPAARPHSSLKLRIEERTLTTEHFNGFPEDKRTPPGRSRVLNPNTATAA